MLKVTGNIRKVSESRIQIITLPPLQEDKNVIKKSYDGTIRKKLYMCLSCERSMGHFEQSKRFFSKHMKNEQKKSILVLNSRVRHKAPRCSSEAVCVVLCSPQV